MGYQKLLLVPYPEKLLDDEGYPTEEALDYIKNWCINYAPTEDENIKTVMFGEYFDNPEKIDELICFIQKIWAYGGTVYDGKLLELHTVGWSGNEDIVRILINSNLWVRKLRAQQTGGHYYFNICDEEFTYKVTKVKNN